MGGRRRFENGILIICDNFYTGESYTCMTVREASLRTGVSKDHINCLIKSGKQTRDGWTFDETDDDLEGNYETDKH